jgi:very-short-patch-repair endonuclease
MSRSAIENIARAVGDHLLGGILADNGYGTTFFQTPIEMWFYKALYLACRVDVSYFELTRIVTDSNSDLCIEPQKIVLDWPVDYVFTVKSECGIVSHLSVECDGHDFHERTKEQAARDRSRDRRLQEVGHTVFRFTGAELYRDAFGCAVQVLKWAEASAWKK